jgi:nitrite reductase (NADH) large subunit
VPSPTALSVVDLGSRNGTTVNGIALNRRVALVPDDVVRLGRSEIIVLHTPTVDPGLPRYDHDATRLAQAVVAPPPPPGRANRSSVVALAERALGIDASGERRLFPAYDELTSKVPLPVWRIIRVASIAGLVTLIVAMFVRPAAGLMVFLGVIVPLLPLLFLIAPGLWRNICPLAASNQMPRVLNISEGRSATGWLREGGYLIAVALFVGIAGARLAGLDHDGPAMGVVLASVLAVAIVGGFVFKARAVGAARSARCCHCSASTDRPHSSPSPTRTAPRASAAPRSATTSSPARPITPTSPTPIPGGAPRATCSWRDCRDSCSASSRSPVMRKCPRPKGFRC